MSAKITFWLSLMLLETPLAKAQDASADRTAKTVLSDSLWISSRGEALADSLGALSEGVDSAQYNPAGLSMGPAAKGQPLVRFLNFPVFGASANNNGIKFNDDFNEKGGAKNATLGKALVDAYAGKRSYGRASFVPAIGLSSLMIGYVADSQLAAVSQGHGSELIDLKFRQQSGLMAGLGASDSKGRFKLGVFAADLNREEIDSTFTYDEIALPDQRSAALKGKSISYHGAPASAGFMWYFSPKSNACLGLSAQDIGGTKYHALGHAANDPSADLKVEQNNRFALSAAPLLSDWGKLGFDLEADRFHETDVSISKKVHAGLELGLWGDKGMNAPLALRAGISNAGASYGFKIRLGLVAMEYADRTIDIGRDNHRLLEQRKSAVLTINVAEH